MEKFDVLVVGAGPGGASSAKKCVDGGLKTLLIERRKLPRGKACSGIIDNMSQNYVYENFGPIPESVYGAPYISKGMGFYFPSVGTIFMDMDCYMLYVWRDRFDHWLAKSSGAVLRDETRFLDVEQNADGVVATLNQKGKIVKVQAKYLIGADGGYSRVVLKVAPEAYDGVRFALACQKYYEGEIDASDRHLYWFLKPDMGPFPWLNVKDGQIIIGLSVLHGDAFAPRFNRLIELLKKDFGLKIKKELAVESCLANTMTILNKFFPGKNRVLMVGDAMGLMHQGHASISAALCSGGHAGEAVIQGLNSGVDALALYKDLMRPEMELCLDQFNPLRMMSTSASPRSKQPPVFQGLSNVEKLMAIKDGLVFMKKEFKVEGMGPIVLKNTLYRLLHGKYDLNI